MKLGDEVGKTSRAGRHDLIVKGDDQEISVRTRNLGEEIDGRNRPGL